MQYSVFAPDGIGEVSFGDSIGEILLHAVPADFFQPGDIVCIAHKIVSKAEGRVIDLNTVSPGGEAEKYAALTGKDPRLVQVILNESTHVVSCMPNGPLICRTRGGFICANAAVDCSNSFGRDEVILLPADADRSAADIRQALEASLGFGIGVMICDTHGRAFREGACGIAVGASGIITEKSYIGLKDRKGRIMRSSVECVADELAAAATMIMGQCDEGRPMAVIRGLSHLLGSGSAKEIVRAPERDLFLPQEMRRGF